MSNRTSDLPQPVPCPRCGNPSRLSSGGGDCMSCLLEDAERVERERGAYRLETLKRLGIWQDIEAQEAELRNSLSQTQALPPAWAREKAREWLVKSGPLEGPGVPEGYGWVPIADYSIDSLAALLAEVALSGPTPDAKAILEAAQHRDDAAKALLKAQLAEVRHVVQEELAESNLTHSKVRQCGCAERILRKLDSMGTAWR